MLIKSLFIFMDVFINVICYTYIYMNLYLQFMISQWYAMPTFANRLKDKLLRMCVSDKSHAYSRN